MNLPSGTVLLDQDFGTSVVNATDVPTPAVYQAVERTDQDLLRALSGWVQSTRVEAFDANGYGPNARNGGLFMRDRYLSPTGIFDQMRTAQHAVESDDVIGGVCDSTESLAFTAMDFYAKEPDEEDAYNQMAARIDLDSRMREIWRELFTVSQCYIGVWWGKQTFKVRGTTTSGNQRRRSLEFVAPRELTLLDPLKVVPVGSTIFGREQLAYIATPGEDDQFAQILNQEAAKDEIVKRLVVSRYTPDRTETAELSNLGVDTRHLWLLDPNNVFRHTVTRPGYRRLAAVQLKSVFELLDMKQQLRQMERAHLVGGTNFIVVITKGSDQLPAQPQEIANLQAQVRTVARVPVMVGDHRLNVEIVTPKLDNTLRAERWNTVDARIAARCYRLFLLGNYSAGTSGDDSIKLVKVMARNMESRRHMIRRSLERHIFRPMFEMNEQLTSMPKLQFHPRSIALDFDAAYASFLFDLRQSKELSRATILNQFDLDEDLEAELRLRERELYDEIFQTQVPFDSPANQVPQPQEPQQALPRDNGGGRRNGGGAAPGTGQGQAPRRSSRRTADRNPSAQQISSDPAEPDDLSDDRLLGGTTDADDDA